MEKEHGEFLDDVIKEFPGCTIEKEEHCEVRIRFEEQLYIVRKNRNGEIESTPFEPNAHGALV